MRKKYVCTKPDPPCILWKLGEFRGRYAGPTKCNLVPPCEYLKITVEEER